MNRGDHKNMDVVILAGGKGTRMWPLTYAIPKSLVPINGIPIIQLIVDFFKANNYRKFIFCIGYKGDYIKSSFNSYDHGLDITYVDSGEDANILKRIEDCKNITSKRFFICYGDTIANVNLNKLLDLHYMNKALVTLTVFQTQSPFGLVFSESSGLVQEFKEKPMLPYWMNIGYMVFEKKALDLVKKGQTFVQFLNKLISMNKLYSFKHNGLHYTFNTESERQRVEKQFNIFYDIITRGIFYEG